MRGEACCMTNQHQVRKDDHRCCSSPNADASCAAAFMDRLRKASNRCTVGHCVSQRPSTDTNSRRYQISILRAILLVARNPVPPFKISDVQSRKLSIVLTGSSLASPRRDRPRIIMLAKPWCWRDARSHRNAGDCSTFIDLKGASRKTAEPR